MKHCHVSSSGADVCVFTGDINRNQIEYILRYGVEATSDSFEFKISDKGRGKGSLLDVCVWSLPDCQCLFCSGLLVSVCSALVCLCVSSL